MKRSIVVIVLALAIALTVISNAAVDAAPRNPIPQICTAQAFRPFSAAVWRLGAWRRGNPPDKVIRAFRSRLSCAPGPHKTAMKAIWERDRAAYFEKRSHELWRERVTPFYGGHHWWAIPYWHVVCESGGDYHVGYGGAYGLTVAWSVYGGRQFAYSAGEASPKEQDLVAHRDWSVNGESSWTPFEGGCSL